jgi:hypothetical protein
VRQFVHSILIFASSLSTTKPLPDGRKLLQDRFDDNLKAATTRVFRDATSYKFHSPLSILFLDIKFIF